MSKTELQLKEDIEDELRWDPRINPAQIAVSVAGGSVSLSGTVDTYAEKWAPWRSSALFHLWSVMS